MQYYGFLKKNTLKRVCVAEPQRQSYLEQGSGSFRCPRGSEVPSTQWLGVAFSSQTMGILAREV